RESAPATIGRQTRERGDQGTIGGLELRPLASPAKHRQMMTQDNQLDVLVEPAVAATPNEQPQDGPERVVGERKNHHATLSRSTLESASNDRTRFRHPSRLLPTSGWTVARRKWLGEQRFEHPAEQITFDSYLRTVDLVDARIEQSSRRSAQRPSRDRGATWSLGCAACAASTP